MEVRSKQNAWLEKGNGLNRSEAKKERSCLAWQNIDHFSISKENEY